MDILEKMDTMLGDWARKEGIMTLTRTHVAAGFLVLGVAVGLRHSVPTFAQSGGRSASKAPTFKVDPFWPKPLPMVKDAEGQSHLWVTGEVGASCIDSHDHIITVNRGFLKDGLLRQEGTQSIPAPPVIVYDTDGNIVTTWGDEVRSRRHDHGQGRHGDAAQRHPRLLCGRPGQHLDRGQRRRHCPEVVTRRQTDAAADRHERIV